MTTTVTITHIDGMKRFEKTVVVSDLALDKVLFGFNVTDDPRVTALKALSAAQIQMMLDHQAQQNNEGGGEPRHARARAASIAITQTELTQMALVKALFAKA